MLFCSILFCNWYVPHCLLSSPLLTYRLFLLPVSTISLSTASLPYLPWLTPSPHYLPPLLVSPVSSSSGGEGLWERVRRVPWRGRHCSSTTLNSDFPLRITDPRSVLLMSYYLFLQLSFPIIYILLCYSVLFYVISFLSLFSSLPFSRLTSLLYRIDIVLQSLSFSLPLSPSLSLKRIT